MLDRVAVGAKGDDLALLGEAVGQARARDEPQVRASPERGDLGRRDPRLGVAAFADEQSRQQPGEARQPQRRRFALRALRAARSGTGP